MFVCFVLVDSILTPSGVDAPLMFLGTDAIHRVKVSNNRGVSKIKRSMAFIAFWNYRN